MNNKELLLALTITGGLSVYHSRAFINTHNKQLDLELGNDCVKRLLITQVMDPDSEFKYDYN